MYTSEATGVSAGSTLAITGASTGSIIVGLIAAAILISSGIAIVIRARRNRAKGVKP